METQIVRSACEGSKESGSYEKSFSKIRLAGGIDKSVVFNLITGTPDHNHGMQNPPTLRNIYSTTVPTSFPIIRRRPIRTGHSTGG